MSSKLSLRISFHGIKLLLIMIFIAPLLMPSYFSLPNSRAGVLNTLISFRLEAVVILTLLMLLTYINNYKSLLMVQRNVIIFYGLYFVIAAAYVILKISSIRFQSLIEQIMWILISIFCVYIYSDTTAAERKKLLHWFLIISTILVVLFCITCTSQIRVYNITGTMVAGAPYTTMLMLYMGVCYIWLLHDKNFITRLLLIVSIIASFYAISFILQRAINTILGIIMILVIQFCNQKRGKNASIIFLIMVIVFLFVYFSGTLEYLLRLIGKATGSARLTDRIESIIAFLSTGSLSSTGHSFNERLDLVERSFLTWLGSIKNFLIGAGEHRSNNLIIGNHGELIDTLARYGIIGSLFIFGGLRRQIISLLGGINSSIIKRQAVCVFVIYLFRGLLGSVFECGMAIQLFFFMPIMAEYCGNEDYRYIGE